MSSDVIKVITWNINGVQNPVKKYKVLSHLKSLECDKAMLQEMHLSKEESLKLKQHWVVRGGGEEGKGQARSFLLGMSKRLR